MKVGGVQKSLYNLLWSLDEAGQYDISLVLFSPVGEYRDKIPPNVKCIYTKSLFRFLGESQQEMRGADILKRGVLVLLCRVFGRPAVMKLLLASQRMLPEEYDCAISYLHDGRRSSFYGGAQDFVLHRIRASKKIAFLHCDYRNCGGNYAENNCAMESFDRIAACSEGCRRAFIEVLPHLAEKCVTVRNCHRYDEIKSLSLEVSSFNSKERLNVITVARLSHEKGIERAVDAAAYCTSMGIPIALHIIGDGNMWCDLHDRVSRLHLEDKVLFYGEQRNPYPMMAEADLLVLSSYHEAAPMVIEEACCLGLPVLTVETTSSREMVTERGCGWVCDNSQEALNQAMAEVLRNESALNEMKNRVREQQVDNTIALSQFYNLIEG